MQMAEAVEITLRPWRFSDKASLIRYANNRKVWINLNDVFPNPYNESHADTWLARCAAAQEPRTHFAIEFQGEAIGGIGFNVLSDVHRKAANIGYWLGEPFWGRGIATYALKQTTAYAFANFELERLEAGVFEWNPASARVLEKAGYALEGRLRRNIIKDGRMGDSLLYARLRE
jgi:ribosomal-protein-alanine N-acetyltransferase